MDRHRLTLVDHRDIRILPGPPAFSSYTFYCSSLEGKRAINDVFNILDIAVMVGSENRFVLQEIDDGGISLPTVYHCNDLGSFKPGLYMIVPEEHGAEIFQRLTIVTFAGSEQAGPRPKARVSDAGSAVSTRDDGPDGFKMRLVYRDKGCVVCDAEGTTSIYQYRDDSRYFEGSPIFPFAKQSTWTLRGYESLMTDPYTATSADNATRNKRDPLRINSLENGILLCLSHHKAYDGFRFSIHPTAHTIFAFHPAVAHLHGLEVTSPWNTPHPMYPSPHPDLLKAHYQTSIFASLTAAAEPLDDDDDDDEEEELPEVSSNHNEAIGIWAEDTNQYPPVDWRLESLENEERDISSPGVEVKDVEIPPSGIRSCAVV